MAFEPYLQDDVFLKQLDELTLKEIFVKIAILDINENFVREIQGRASSGQISIDGDSSVRRTGNITFLPDEREGDLTDIENIISINKKVRIKIGYTNTLTKYTQYSILWFPLGTFAVLGATSNRSVSSSTISISLQDKMSFLNGVNGGSFPAAVTLHADADDNLVPIYQIIQEVVNHFGGEDLSRIIIDGISTTARKIVKWTGDNPLYLIEDENGLLEFKTSDASGIINDTFETNDNIGYQYTPFTFPGELIADAGQTITTILDKIRDTLGNYEYFYDLHGNFRFQEIRNYLNTSQATTLISEMTSQDYLAEYISDGKTVYDFNDKTLITAISNTPVYDMIKNDFVVWGIRNLPDGSSFPIRYHLALDTKPLGTEFINDNQEDWRNVFYREGLAAESTYALDSNFYYLELKNEWPKLYDVSGFVWKDAALENPSDIDYYLDFIDTSSVLNELSVENIGRRSVIVTDNAINCIFAPDLPDTILVEKGDTEAIAEAILKGMIYAEMDATFLAENVAIGDTYQDAFSVVRDMLYKHTSYNNSINIQTIPIYHLDVNTIIGVYDDEGGIYGNFLAKNISVPLSISEQMSINASAITERI